MKTVILTSFFLLACSLTSLLQAQESNNYYDQYANVPLPVTNKTGGANSRVYLVDNKRGELYFRFKPDAKEEITIPLDTEGLFISFAKPRTYNDHVAMIRRGNYDQAVEGMRPYAYPLLKYVDIPSENINIHPVIERFVFALANSEQLDEAFDVVKRLPLNDSDPRFVDYTFKVTEGLVDAGRSDEALILLNRIPLSKEQSNLLPSLMSFANSLREAGNPREALFIYERVQDAAVDGLKDEAILWTAYCNMELENLQKAELFVDLVGKLKPTDRAFSLQKLVEGRLDMAKGNNGEAMRKVSHGVVSADVGYPWMPELLYLSGFLYESLEKPDVAEEIYGEVDLFYASTAWGEKSRERLAGLKR